MSLTADVCIVGSGAGGGVLAHQIAIVHVQTGGADGEHFSGEALLHDLVVLCLEGLLGDPRHGGGCPRHTR